MNERFLSYFQPENVNFASKIGNCHERELLLVTPQYLSPYLRFIKDHKKLFLTAATKSVFMNYCEETYQKMFQNVFTPIMDRLDIPVSERNYVIAFYVNGIFAIVIEWLKNGCSDRIEQITDMIVKYVAPNGFGNRGKQ